jgi:hypothetical protein
VRNSLVFLFFRHHEKARRVNFGFRPFFDLLQICMFTGLLLIAGMWSLRFGEAMRGSNGHEMVTLVLDFPFRPLFRIRLEISQEPLEGRVVGIGIFPV